jgi:hypothetical protein
MNELERRFEGKYTPEPNSGCWLWDASVYPRGYGVFEHPDTRYAHRASWIFRYGSIPENLCVLHKCDVRSCVNPDHLFLGTQADNMKDMDNKRRRRPARGVRAASAKLTEDIVREIKLDHRPAKDLARAYGVQPEAIHKIRRGERWRHVS